MSILREIFGYPLREDLKRVRITQATEFSKKYEITGDTIWFGPNNIDQCIRVTHKLGIQNIHLQTKEIDFLKDPRLSNVKNIFVQYKVGDLTPLYSFKDLTHLTIAEENNKQFDLSHFKELKYLNGMALKKYVNYQELGNLKYLRLRNYNKKDFTELVNCKNLKRLEIYSLNCENLNGLSELKNLREIELELCPRLTSLDGLTEANDQLEVVSLFNCKRLKDVSQLSSLPGIKKLVLGKIQKLDSFDFLRSANSIEELFIDPRGVGVEKDDYYPLVEKFLELGRIDQIKKWPKLDDYLNKRVDINAMQESEQSELQLILENLSIKGWSDKYGDGLEQYTEENCEKAVKIITDLVEKLEQNSQLNNVEKTTLIKESVIEFNRLNESLDGCFIETGEREELCEIFDNIADSVGIDIQKYDDGIASEWREW